MWYVYFLQLSNGDVYVGSTDDLKRRFGSHSRGKVKSTKAYLPVVLKSYVAVSSGLHARQLEVYFKSGSGKAFAKKRLLNRSRLFRNQQQKPQDPGVCLSLIYRAWTREMADAQVWTLTVWLYCV